MKLENRISKILNQDYISDEVLRDLNKNIFLVEGELGIGKKYLTRLIEQKILYNKDYYVVRLSSTDFKYSVDYLPFVKFLFNHDDTEWSNFKNTIFDLADAFTKIGKIISIIKKNQTSDYLTLNNIELNIFKKILKVINGRIPLFICEDLEKWDEQSKNFLYKIIDIYKGKELYSFIITSCCTTFPSNIFTKKYNISKIETKDAGALKHFLKEKTYKFYTLETITKIIVECEGNIGLILEMNNLLLIDNYNSNTYKKIILENINNKLILKQKNDAKEMILHAAFIGDNFNKFLYKEFINYELPYFQYILNHLMEINFFLEKDNIIIFKNIIIWKIFNAEVSNNFEYGYKLINAMQKIIPSNFFYRSNLFDLVKDNYEKAIYYCLNYINILKNYKKKEKISEEAISLLEKANIYDFFQKINSSYEMYYLNQKNEALFLCNSIDCTDYRLLYEKDYFEATLIYEDALIINSLEESYNKINKWYLSNKLKNNEPYLWIKCAILLLGIVYELQNIDYSKRIQNDIETFFLEYKTTDKTIEILYYDYLSKANIFFSVDISHRLTYSASNYFRKNYKILPSPYHLYISLLNHSANCLVMGEYENCIKCSVEIYELINQNSNLEFNNLDAVVNNFHISSILLNPLKKNFKIAIKELKSILRYNSNNIDNILLKINISVLETYNNNFEKGFEIIKELFEEYKYIDDLDAYYKYIIINNYYIMSFIETGDFAIINKLKEIERYMPLNADRHYFNARNKCIFDLLSNGKMINTDNKKWNDLLDNKVGPAWSFWGKWLLFSDMQIWSD